MLASTWGVESSRSGVEATARVVHADEHRWVLDLTVRTSTGELGRRLDARTCSELAEMTGFVIAMHVVGARGDVVRDAVLEARPAHQRPRMSAAHPPDSVEEELRLETTPEPDARTPAKPELTVPELRDVYVVEDEPGRRVGERQLRAGMFSYAGVGFGALPVVDVPLGLGIAILGPRFRAQLSGTHWLTRDESLAGGGSVSVSMWGGRVGAGPSFGFGRVGVPVLGAVELGAMTAQAHGIDHTRRETVAWAGAGLAPGVSIRVHPVLHVWVEAYGFVALYRPQFYVAGLGRVHHAGPAGGRLALGLELRLPGMRSSP